MDAVVPFRSISVGVDFSAPSRTAAVAALRLARLGGATVRALHVVDTVGPGPGDPASLDERRRGIVEGLVADARRRWTDWTRDAPALAALPLDVEVGNFVGGWRRHVERHGADLAIVGATGAGRARVGVGTCASAVVRDAPADALIVRDDGHPATFCRVVVGVDFSAASRRALAACAWLAARDGAALHAVHVAGLGADEDAAATRLGAEVTALRGAYPSLVIVAEVEKRLGTRGGLVDYAEAVGADLIGVGTRGAGGFAGLLLGGVAEGVLRDSRCAVWAAKPPRAP